jgi:hypothetical protein
MREVVTSYREELSDDPHAPFRRKRTRERCARTFLSWEVDATCLRVEVESLSVSVNQVIGPTVDSTRPRVSKNFEEHL